MWDEILGRKISLFDKTRLGFETNFKEISWVEVRYQWWKMKEGLEIVMKNYKKISPPVGIEDLTLGKLRHHQGPFPLGMKIFFLVIFLFVKILYTNQFIINFMHEIIIWGTLLIINIQRTTMQIIGLEMLKGLLIQVTIHLIHWYIITLYATNVIIFSTRHVIEDIWNMIIAS